MCDDGERVHSWKGEGDYTWSESSMEQPSMGCQSIIEQHRESPVGSFDFSCIHQEELEKWEIERHEWDIWMIKWSPEIREKGHVHTEKEENTHSNMKEGRENYMLWHKRRRERQPIEYKRDRRVYHGVGKSESNLCKETTIDHPKDKHRNTDEEEDCDRHGCRRN